MNDIGKRMPDYLMPLTFDEYQRYKMVSIVLEYYRETGEKKSFKILEIGANKLKHLHWFCPGDKILLTDIELDEEMQKDPEFQAVDGTDMPFDDGSFDFVVATDLLEHIPHNKRNCLLCEAVRVAKYAAIITFPYYSQDVVMAENRVNTYYKAIRGEDYIWLKEHREQGLPKIEDVDACLQDVDCGYFHVLRGDIVLWETMYYSLFDALDDEREWEFRRQIDQFYINELFASDVSESCYRAVYVLTHKDSSLLQMHLQEQTKDAGDTKRELLKTLFQAQRKIHIQRIGKWTDRELEEKSIRIRELEAKIESTEVHWRADVDHWTADVRAWEKEYEEKTAEITYLMQRVKQSTGENIEKQAQLEASEARQAELMGQLEESRAQQTELMRQLEESREQYRTISEAFFWRLTKPMRAVLDFFKRLR